MLSETLKQLIAERTGIDAEKISPESHFEEDLNLSRIELAEFLTFLEDHFKIDLHHEDVVSLRTVADLKTLIQDELNEI